MLLDSDNTFFPRLCTHCYSNDISDVDENYLNLARARLVLRAFFATVLRSLRITILEQAE